MNGLACWLGCGLGVGIGLALGCGQGDAFACSSDAQCVQGSQTGFCEESGWCSFEDPDCPSGRRYGALAGGGLAHTCVDAAGTDAGSGTMGGTGSDPTSSSAPTDPSVDPPSTTASDASGPPGESSTGDPPLPDCGDGDLDPGEDCDDGDDEVGDGCNPDCRVSGTVICSDVGEVDLPLASYAIDLAWIGDDFVITGYEQTEDEGDNVALRRYDAQCGVVWTVSHDEIGITERGLAIAIDEDDTTVWVAGTQIDDSEVPARYVARFDVDGGFIGSETLGFGSALAVVAAPGGGAIVGGNVGDSFETAVAWVAHYDAEGTMVDQLLGTAAEADRVRGLALFAPNTLFAAGNRGSDVNDIADLVVDAVAPSGFVELARVAPKIGLADGQAIAVGEGGDLFVGGYVQVAEDPPSATAPRDAYIARFTQEGELVWADVHATPAVANSDEVEAIAIAPNDDVIVGGFLNAGAATASDLWLRRYTPEGDIRWDVTIDVGVADIVRAVAFAPSGRLAVVGEVQGNDGFMNLWVGVIAP